MSLNAKNLNPINLNDSINIGLLIGEYKGIQGYINSCYLDTLLMAMFPFTNVFDDIFDKKDFDNQEIVNIKNCLFDTIVKPLRK